NALDRVAVVGSDRSLEGRDSRGGKTTGIADGQGRDHAKTIGIRRSWFGDRRDIASGDRTLSAVPFWQATGQIYGHDAVECIERTTPGGCRLDQSQQSGTAPRGDSSGASADQLGRPLERFRAAAQKAGETALCDCGRRGQSLDAVA